MVWCAWFSIWDVDWFSVISDLVRKRGWHVVFARRVCRVVSLACVGVSGFVASVVCVVLVQWLMFCVCVL